MNILIVDNNHASRQQTVNHIQQAGHHTLEARSAEHALTSLSRHQIDMLVLDSSLPGICALDLIRTVRAQFQNWFPILLLSELDHHDYLAEGIHAGADDYLLKPLSEPLLNAKLSALGRINQMKQALDAANRKLREQSTQDSLTGLNNRRWLDHCLKKEWSRHRRENSELAILMIDIDYFKAYNDSYGHLQGDHCLRQVSAQLNKCLKRPHDQLARYGGEEFIAVLPQTSLEGAHIIAQQMLTAIRTAEIPHCNSEINTCVTVTIGISTTRLSASQSTELIEQADQALYQAKHSGRDQAIGYGEITTLINNASSRPSPAA